MYNNPRHSMFGIFTYIGVVSGVNVGIYSIHGGNHMNMTVGGVINQMQGLRLYRIHFKYLSQKKKTLHVDS